MTGWYYYNSNCYYPSTWAQRTTQPRARKRCLKMDADLVSITDKNEMDFVLSISYELTWIIIDINVIKLTAVISWLLG